MENITITIHYGENEGYLYDIYAGTAEEVAADTIESLDGGCCTGTLEDALGMATEQAREIIRSKSKAK